MENTQNQNFEQQLNQFRYLKEQRDVFQGQFEIINASLGNLFTTKRTLESLEGVKEVHGTFGAYDILAKIESDTVETLRETITWKIRKIEKIRSTLTLMGIEGQT